MTKLPPCEAGRVIGYTFLWSHEAAAGLENGHKDRPCVILTARDEGNSTVAFVLPITHRPPNEPGKAVEIPVKVKNRMGLDSRRSWVICDEINKFDWPGPDIALVRTTGQELKSDLGPLPPGLFAEVQSKAFGLVHRREVNLVPRFF